METKHKKKIVMIITGMLLAFICYYFTSDSEHKTVKPASSPVQEKTSAPSSQTDSPITPAPVKPAPVTHSAPAETQLSDLPPPPKDITGKPFIEKLMKDIPNMPDSQIDQMKTQLLMTDKIDIAEYALAFSESSDKKVENLGLQLLTGICISRPEFFRPVEMYKKFAEKGFASSPFLSEIIEKTDDDFCREWACELSADIYYHNTDNKDPRHQKLREFTEREENIYAFLKEILSDYKKTEQTVNSGKSLSEIIIKQWGDERRRPLKMQALISTLDLMTKDNITPSMTRANQILSTCNYNYNILGRMNGKIVESPPLPEEARLKRFVDAVFKNGYKNSYHWLPPEEGGFTIDEIEDAVNEGNRPEMRRIIAGFKKIITGILKMKILIGLGNNELELLRHFSQATWQNRKFNWNNKMIQIINRSGIDAPLTIISEDSDSDSPTKFYVPRRSQFIWFVPEGKYIIKATAPGLPFSRKDITVKDSNIIIEITP